MSAEGNKKWTKNFDNFETVAYVGDGNEECDEEEDESEPSEENTALSQPVPHARVRPLKNSRSFSQPDYIYYPEIIPRRNHENSEKLTKRKKKKNRNTADVIEKIVEKRKRNAQGDILDNELEPNSKRAKLSRPLKSKAKKKM